MNNNSFRGSHAAAGANNDGGSGGGINNSIIGPCGACKFLRRKCVSGCVFAPYFQFEQGSTYFAAVHKVFGASNASKMLLSIPPHERLDAVVSMCYEALARVRDPVYGCVAQIFSLQQQVLNLQAELANTQARLATLHQHPQQHDQTLLAAEFQSVLCGMMQPDQQTWSADMASVFVDQGEIDDGEDEELQSLARDQLVSKHSFDPRPPTTSP